jgi:hypothetical protein
MPTTADRPRLLLVACAFALNVSGAELFELFDDCAVSDADHSTPASASRETVLDTDTADLLREMRNAHDMPRLMRRWCFEREQDTPGRRSAAAFIPTSGSSDRAP